MTLAPDAVHAGDRLRLPTAYLGDARRTFRAGAAEVRLRGCSGVVLLLTLFAVSLALLVFGSTLGRFIGLPMLAVSVFVAVRAVREGAD